MPKKFCENNMKTIIVKKYEGVFQKFCITQPFSAFGHTVALKLCAHVTEDILSTRAKFYSNRLKIM